jgi:hypothetical protein
MEATATTGAKPVWIRGPQLRQRWGAMPNSTFYDRLKKGLIPPAEYPFGESTPYWRLDAIEAHERKASEVAA